MWHRLLNPDFNNHTCSSTKISALIVFEIFAVERYSFFSFFFFQIPTSYKSINIILKVELLEIYDTTVHKYMQYCGTLPINYKCGYCSVCLGIFMLHVLVSYCIDN